MNATTTLGLQACKLWRADARTHAHKHVSYAADAFVFNVQELLLRELHVQEVLEDKSITEHSTLQSKGKIDVIVIII